MGHRSIDAQFKELRDILLPLARGFADFDNHVKTLSEAVGMVTSWIASVEQTLNALSSTLANNTSKGLQSGSIPFGKNPICWRVTNLSEFIAKQVPCQSGLFLKHEANAKTLLLDMRMMVFLMRLTVPFAARQCRSIEDREMGKQFAPLWRVLADQLKNSLSWWRWRRCFHPPSAGCSLTNPQHQRSQKRNWKTGFQTCSAW